MEKSTKLTLFSKVQKERVSSGKGLTNNMEYTTEDGEEVWIAEGSIQKGKMLVEEFVWEDKTINPDPAILKEDIGDEIAKIMAQKYKGLRDNPLLETDLRKLDEPIVNKGTQKARILVCMGKMPIATSHQIKEKCDVTGSSVSPQLTELRRMGLISILDTNGESSYKHVLTHVGTREVIRLKEEDEKQMDKGYSFHPEE